VKKTLFKKGSPQGASTKGGSVRRIGLPFFLSEREIEDDGQSA
jgi:hypothetical protein